MSAEAHREQHSYQNQRTTRTVSRGNSGKRDQQERHPSDIENISATSHKTPHASTSQSHDEQRSNRRERKKTYKRRNENTLPSPPIETPITSVLGDLREDIEETNFPPQHTELAYGDGVEGDGGLLRGRPHGPIYVESRTGFSQITRERAFHSEEGQALPFWGYWSQSYHNSVLENKPVHLAINIQACWMPLATFFHGILAGLSLMQTLFVEIVAERSPKGILQFAAAYGKISQAFSSMVYILVTMCLIAVFDRMDVSYTDCRNLLELLGNKPRFRWLLVPLYTIAVVMTYLAARTDDWLATRNAVNISWSATRNAVNISSIGNVTEKTSEKTDLQMFEAWRIFNILRCTCVITGWMILAAAQPKDLLLRHLEKMRQPLPSTVS